MSAPELICFCMEEPLFAIISVKADRYHRCWQFTVDTGWPAQNPCSPFGRDDPRIISECSLYVYAWHPSKINKEITRCWNDGESNLTLNAVAKYNHLPQTARRIVSRHLLCLETTSFQIHLVFEWLLIPITIIGKNSRHLKVSFPQDPTPVN